MSYKILKRPQVERDIEECFVFIAEENLDAGVYFLVAVEESIEQIGRFPLIGKVLEFRNPRLNNLRMWRVKKYADYLIFYSVKEDTVEIIRFLHSARDLKTIFDE